MSEATSPENIQTKPNFYKRLFQVMLPIVVSGVISSSLSLLDNLMVGSLGETALSGVGLAGQFGFFEWMIVFGVCSGCSTFYAQFWGPKDLAGIRKTIGINWCITVPVGILFTLLSLLCPRFIMGLLTNIPELIESGSVYLRFVCINFFAIGFCQPLYTSLKATQQTKIPMMISSSSFLIDVILNYMLIFGKLGCPALGVKGAAIATAAARAYEVVMLIIVVFVRQNMLAAPIKEFFSFSKDFARRVLRNTVTTTVNESLWGLATVTYSAIYGRLDISSYAAYQACSAIMDVFVTAGFACGDASLIFVGEALGKNDKAEAKAITKRLIKTGIIFSSMIALIVIAVGPYMLPLFALTEVGMAKAKLVMLVRACGVPFNVMIAMFISGIFRSGGDTRFAAITEISTMYLIGIPCVYIAGLVIGLPVHLIILCSYIENVVKLSICVGRYRSGKWLNNVIENMK